MDARQPLDDTLTVPGAPSLPGLSFRHFRGATDFPHMLTVSAASAEADKLERAATVEEIADTYRHL